MKKFLTLALSAVLALGMMTGCTATTDNGELVVNTMFGLGDTHEATFLRYNNEFVEETGAKVVNKSGVATDNNWLEGFKSDMTSKNNVPDVVFFFSGAQSDAWRDQLVTVEEIRKEYPDFVSNIVVNDNDPASIEMKSGAQAIMYNADVYDEADFDTYESMMTALKAEVGSEKTQAAVSGDLPHYWFNHFMAYNLGVEEYASFDGTKEFFTAEKLTLWKEAFVNTITAMREIGFVGRGATNGIEASAFYAGDRGIAIDGQWVAGNVDTAQSADATKDKILFSQFPEDINGETFVVGGVTNGWYITKQAWEDETKRDLAVKYIEIHSQNEAVDSYCTAGGGIPATGIAVTSAGYGALGFTSVINDATTVIAIDDRISAAAKAEIMGDWSVNVGMPKLLDATTAPTVDACNALFDAFVAKL